jgi:broad specificity phosphatase PhoE
MVTGSNNKTSPKKGALSMKIYIVRHGDKEKGNYHNEYLRHQDQPISHEGNQKAKKLVEYFEDIHIEKILISEYLRTEQTARYIAANKELQVIKDKRINEFDNGIIELMSNEEIKEKYPEFWDDLIGHAKDVRFPEGETGEEVKARQKDLLDELILRDEDVLLISHEGYMRLLLCHLLDIPVYKRYLFRVNFCGIMELEYMKDEKYWRVIRFNQEA